MDNNLPVFLRVEEAASILRISRSSAYELANRWLATDGRTGLPVIRLGRSLRVPSAAIERLQLVGVIPEDPDHEVEAQPTLSQSHLCLSCEHLMDHHMTGLTSEALGHRHPFVPRSG